MHHSQVQSQVIRLEPVEVAHASARLLCNRHRRQGERQVGTLTLFLARERMPKGLPTSFLLSGGRGANAAWPPHRSPAWGQPQRSLWTWACPECVRRAHVRVARARTCVLLATSFGLGGLLCSHALGPVT